MSHQNRTCSKGSGDPIPLCAEEDFWLPLWDGRRDARRKHWSNSKCVCCCANDSEEAKWTTLEQGFGRAEAQNNKNNHADWKSWTNRTRSQKLMSRFGLWDFIDLTLSFLFFSDQFFWQKDECQYQCDVYFKLVTRTVISTSHFKCRCKSRKLFSSSLMFHPDVKMCTYIITTCTNDEERKLCDWNDTKSLPHLWVSVPFVKQKNSHSLKG